MNSILRIIFLGYFISHIPITLCIDLQGLFGSHYPQPLQDLFAGYIFSFNDVVMLEMKPWIKSFLYCEMLFQFPFFFYVTHGLIVKSNAIRIPSIVYGAHVFLSQTPRRYFTSLRRVHSRIYNVYTHAPPYLLRFRGPISSPKFRGGGFFYMHFNLSPPCCDIGDIRR